MTIIEWLESDKGETWSKNFHARLKHHALIEDHEDLPHGHSPGIKFTAKNTQYEETAKCACLGGPAFFETSETWHCSPNIKPPADWWDTPYDPDWRF